MAAFRQYILYIGICLGVLASPFCVTDAEAKDFTVVIDAGHGGHDPGALGKKKKEKQINLDIALRVGRLISKNCPDVRVIYTRERDVFVTLERRAEIANNAKADLFISIHTNALPRNHKMKGSSTWTLGLAKSEENLEVAKRENAVILYEDDYRARYEGFNPDSSESYIIFEFMQDKHMSQSVHLATLMQQQFKTTCRRNDHGVHQAGFLVLKATAMPSILIELGYISTPEDEQYMSSEAGAQSLANGIYRAFVTYKREQQLRRSSATATSVATTPARNTGRTTSSPSPTQPTTTTGTGNIVFKVQVMASVDPVSQNDRRLKGLKDVDHYREKGYYKYTCGASSDYNEMLRLRRKLLPRFKDAFVIAFKDGKKMNINQAIKEFKQSKNKK